MRHAVRAAAPRPEGAGHDDQAEVKTISGNPARSSDDKIWCSSWDAPKWSMGRHILSTFSHKTGRIDPLRKDGIHQGSEDGSIKTGNETQGWGDCSFVFDGQKSADQVPRPSGSDPGVGKTDDDRRVPCGWRPAGGVTGWRKRR